MAIDREELIGHMKKFITFIVTMSYKASRNHPLVFSLALYILVLHSYFPTIFAFLVSISPVVFCTTFLLGVLLSCGALVEPEIKHEKYKGAQGVSTLKTVATAMNLFVKKDEILLVETHLGQKNEIHEMGVRESAFSPRDCSAYLKSEGSISAALAQTKGDEKVDILIAGAVLSQDNNVEIHSEDRRDVQSNEILDSKETYGEKTAEDIKQEEEQVSGFCTTNPFEGLNLVFMNDLFSVVTASSVSSNVVSGQSHSIRELAPIPEVDPEFTGEEECSKRRNEANFAEESTESSGENQNAVREKKEILNKFASYDEIHSEDLEIADIDESLLQELEAIGDFHVGENAPFLYEVSLGKYNIDANESQSLPASADLDQYNESYSFTDNPRKIESEVGIWSLRDYPELNVHNLKLQILASDSNQENVAVLKSIHCKHTMLDLYFSI